MIRTTFALGAATVTLLAASIALDAPAQAAPMVAVSATFDAFDDAKQAAENTYLTGLEELADWCHGEKAFRQRNSAYEAILALDPDHKKARKFLKYTFDKKKNEWLRKRAYKLPKAGKPEPVAQAKQRRKALNEAYAAAKLEVVERFLGKIDKKRERKELEQLLKATPDHPRVRELLGFVAVKRGGKTVWMTQAAKETEERREKIATTLEEMRDAAPDAEEVELISPEDEVSIDWDTQMGNKRVRVLGDIDEDEAEQGARMGYVAYDFLPFIAGGNVPAPKQFTYYLLGDPGTMEEFIDSYPGMTDDMRASYPNLRSGWMPGGVWRVGCWAETPEQRLDVALKQTTAFFMREAYGVTSERGWISEGFGLYINQLVLGTRYSYSITVTDYDDPSKVDTDREMADTEADWLDLAGEILEDAPKTELAKTLGRNSMQMSPDDIVLAYALSKFLREAYGREALVKVFTKVGKGEASSVVAIESFFDAKIPDIQRMLKEWIDEVGGNDFE